VLRKIVYLAKTEAVLFIAGTAAVLSMY